MMDYLGFVLPSSGIEWLFFIVIFGLSVGNLVLLPLFAKEANWEDRWEAGTRGAGQEDDDFDIAHGSIFELSSAVATWPERCAEVLPSLLLVIGLLGTFLGVGFALDSAAGVLGNKDGDPSKLISDMLPMLEGMGALFKSSIYGIICFLAFSLIRNALGYEKRRLTWCIKRCYGEIVKEREYKAKMVQALENMSESIGSSLEVRLNRVFKEVTSNFSKTFETLSSDNERILESTREVIGVASNVASSMNNLVSKANQEFETMARSVETISEKSGKLADTVQSSVPQFEKAVETMSDGFENVAKKQIPELMKQIVDGQEKQAKMVKEVNSSMVEFAKKNSQTQNTMLQNMNENVLAAQKSVKDTLKAVNIDRVVEKIGDSFDEMQKHMDALQRNLLKEQREMLTKLAAAVPARKVNPPTATTPAQQDQERKKTIEGIVRNALNPGIYLGGKSGV